MNPGLNQIPNVGAAMSNATTISSCCIRISKDGFEAISPFDIIDHLKEFHVCQPLGPSRRMGDATDYGHPMKA